MKKACLGLSVMSVFLMSSCSVMNKYGFYSHSSKYHVIDNAGEVFNDTVKNINIDWVSGKVSVLQSDKYEGVAVFESTSELLKDKFLCHIWHDDADLNIKYCQSNISIPNSVNKQLTVYVPTNATYNLEINNVSCEIEITGGNYTVVDIDNVSGAVTLNNCNAKKISYEGVSGSLACNLSQVTKSMDIEQVSGSIILSLPDNTAGFTLEYSSVSSNFTSDFETTKINKDTYVYQDGNYLKIEAEVVSATFSIVKYVSNVLPVDRESDEVLETVE